MNIKVVLKTFVLFPLLPMAACGSDPVGPSNQIATQTGGIGTRTGGLLATGGSVPGTGGNVLVTGGVTPVTGGAVGTTGGAVGTTGGAVGATGGAVGATGGAVGATGGAVGTTGGAVGTTGGAVATGGAATSAAECEGGSEPKFSFFVTSIETMREQSGSQNGFGGDLGGLTGADAICQTAAANVGCDAKIWRAFLSVNDDGTGQQVNAIDRVGNGPWYDARGYLIAQNSAGLINRGGVRLGSLSGGRPDGDAAAINDLANEFGEGLDSAFGQDDNHDIITGTNDKGELAQPGQLAKTCNDWTSTTVDPGDFLNGVQMGHAWPAGSGQNWIESHGEGSCAAGVNLIQDGPGNGTSIGAGGGWGAIYCFALQP